MRFSTVLSSFVMAAAGAFSFAYYMNGYDGVAFILGAALLIFGFFQLLSYVIGFRKDLMPESMFVEGALSFVLGLLVLFNFVQEANLPVYFGLWFFTCGVTRFSEALAVSRVNPSNWFAVLPLGIVNTLLGFVMLLPDMLAGFDILMVIAVCFILQAFSTAIYALYMVKRGTSQKAKEAKERAEAKKLAAEEKRKERDRIRALSEAERVAELEAQRLEKIKAAEAKAALKEAKKEARRDASEKTIEFTAEETQEIIEATNPAKENFGPAIWEDSYQDVSADALAAEFDALTSMEPLQEETPKEELITRPVFNRPVNIPTIEKTEFEYKVEEEPKKLDVESKRGIMNLEEMEDRKFDEELEEVELPKVELMSTGGEAAQRDNFIQEIKDETVQQEEPVDLSNFTPLTLEDLFADEKYNIKPLTDAKSRETDLRLTQTFTFDWLDTKRR